MFSGEEKVNQRKYPGIRADMPPNNNIQERDKSKKPIRVNFIFNKLLRICQKLIIKPNNYLSDASCFSIK